MRWLKMNARVIADAASGHSGHKDPSNARAPAGTSSPALSGLKGRKTEFGR
ncbi:MAG: hypothetical protein J0L77_07660 [Alphaproteobacteria bacterium]|nr:hypothetical protein [Alphaproteobacteria bacterium]